MVGNFISMATASTDRDMTVFFGSIATGTSTARRDPDNSAYRMGAF